jgi:hypothetical protein
VAATSAPALGSPDAGLVATCHRRVQGLGTSELRVSAIRAVLGHLEFVDVDPVDHAACQKRPPARSPLVRFGSALHARQPLLKLRA